MLQGNFASQPGGPLKGPADIILLIDCLLIALDAHMFSHSGYGPGTRAQGPWTQQQHTDERTDQNTIQTQTKTNPKPHQNIPQTTKQTTERRHPEAGPKQATTYVHAPQLGP